MPRRTAHPAKHKFNRITGNDGKAIPPHKRHHATLQRRAIRRRKHRQHPRTNRRGFRADRYRRRLDGLLVRHRKPLCRARRTDRPDAQRREPRRRLYPQPGTGDSAREFHYVHGCRRPLFAGTFRPPDSILRTAPADRPVRQLLYDVRAGRCPGTEDPGSHHARRNPDPDAFRLPVRNVGGHDAPRGLPALGRPVPGDHGGRLPVLGGTFRAHAHGQHPGTPLVLPQVGKPTFDQPVRPANPQRASYPAGSAAHNPRHDAHRRGIADIHADEPPGRDTAARRTYDLPRPAQTTLPRKLRTQGLRSETAAQTAGSPLQARLQMFLSLVDRKNQETPAVAPTPGI